MTLIAVNYRCGLSDPKPVIFNADAIDVVNFTDHFVEIGVAKGGWSCYYEDNPKLKEWLQNNIIDFRLKNNKQDPIH